MVNAKIEPESSSKCASLDFCTGGTKVAIMIHIRQTGAWALTLLIALTGLAHAEGEPKQIGAFDDWLAYSYDAADSKVCYVSSTPKSSEPKNAKRDPAFFLVTHMPGRKPPVRGEVSTIIGYPFKEGQIVKLTIDDKSYEMFSKGDTAWVDTGSDKKIVAAMKAGKTLKVEGTSWRGTQTVDNYSLVGISAALAAIDQACK
jgi:hypothetical protein